MGPGLGLDWPGTGRFQGGAVHIRLYPDNDSALYIHAKAIVADAGRVRQRVRVGRRTSRSPASATTGNSVSSPATGRSWRPSARPSPRTTPQPGTQPSRRPCPSAPAHRAPGTRIQPHRLTDVACGQLISAAPSAANKERLHGSCAPRPPRPSAGFRPCCIPSSPVPLPPGAYRR